MEDSRRIGLILEPWLLVSQPALSAQRVSHHGRVINDGRPPIGWIREIVLDCDDPWVLARFWAGLLGGTPVEWYPGWVTLEPPPHGQRLSFQGVAPSDGGLPAVTDAGPLPVHFDILVADIAAAGDRVIEGGGTYVAEHVSPRPGTAGGQVPWRVYADPAGHAFCLVVR